MLDDVKLLPCPFCAFPLTIAGGCNPYGRCDTDGCWMSARKVAVPLDDPRQVAAWNTRASLPQADREGGGAKSLQRIGEFIANYFEPWGSWKTAWWEGEVSDEAEFSDASALRHIASIVRNALKGRVDGD